MMDNKWKVAAATAVLLTPVAIAHADNSTSSTQVATTAAEDQQRALIYFEHLDINSSLIDTQIYDEVLALPTLTAETKNLLRAKLEYIRAYKQLSLTAESLKTEIGKLAITSKTLKTDVEGALAKYNAMLSDLSAMNTQLRGAINAAFSADPNTPYAAILTNLKPYYENSYTVNNEPKNVTMIDIMANLIGAANQQTLITREIQIKNVFETKFNADHGVTATKTMTYEQLINRVHGAPLATITKDVYQSYLADVKSAYALLSVDEKKIADAQTVTGESTTYKQVLTNGETNLTKAAAFDAEIVKFDNLSVTGTPTAAEIKSLSTQLATVNKSYSSLSDLQRKLIAESSKTKLQPFQYLLDIASKISNLKITTANQYRADVGVITGLVDGLDAQVQGSSFEGIAEQLIPGLDLYEAALADIEKADRVDERILELKIDKTVTPNSVPTTAQIKERRAAFNALTPNQRKLVNTVDKLLAWENAEKNALNVDKKIDAITVSAKMDFASKYQAAKEAFDALDPDIEVYFMKKTNRLTSLAYYADVVKRYNSLKLTDPTYTADMTALLQTVGGLQPDNTVVWETAWQDTTLQSLPLLSTQDIDALKSLRNVLLDRRGNTEIAADLVDKINLIQTVDSADLLQALVEYRATYNRLDATGKKLVTNIKQLTAFEKQYISAIKFVTAVDQLDVLTKDFTKQAANARKLYEKLAANLRPYVVPSKAALEEYERVSSLMQQIVDLSKSKNILVDVKNAKDKYEETVTYLSTVAVLPLQTVKTEVTALLQSDYYPLLDVALTRDNAVKSMVDRINGLALNQTSSVGLTIEQIAIDYKSLSSNDKKLVQNYSLFKMIEKNYKTAQKVYGLIESLPTKEASNYSTQVEKALAAYRKLTNDQRNYVFNYQQKLEPFIAVASLIGDIDELSPSMKNYMGVVADLRNRYNALTQAEKTQIHNYAKLEAAENAALGVDQVIRMIREARPGVENYLNALQAARDAYNSLSKDQQKQVSNIADLTAREKAVKPVLDLNDTILKIELQSNAKSFITMYEKAWKSLDAISLADRALLTNEKVLTEKLPPIYNVMKQIEAIKNTSATFVADVTAARNRYNALSATDRNLVLNLPLLVEHELNVLGGAYVDDLIRALKTNPAAVYVEKVQEASEAYKNLSASNKKAVTLYNELKLEEKFIKPVVDAMTAIDQLAIATDKIDSQVKKVQSLLGKLSEEQLKLIPNMSKFNDLGNVIHTINLIELIKPTDTKYYMGNTKAAEIAYNRLSQDEKSRVSNYGKLEDALLNVAALDEIIRKISEISYTSQTFASDVEARMAEYKKLPSALKGQVTNYPALEQMNKDLVAATKVVTAIAAIDPSVRTFESKVLAARKLYVALNDTQKSLVSNLRLLVQYEQQLGL